MINRLDDIQVENALRIIGSNVCSPVNEEKSSRILFSRAEGYKVYDKNGKEYIDLINGKGSVMLGHNDPDVKKAIIEAINTNQNILTGPSEHIIELAELIVSDLGLPNAKISFFTTGTAACRAAVTTARNITNKTMVISAGYHGWDEMWNFNTSLLEPNRDGVIDFFFVPELLEKALKLYADKTALVIFSPDYVYTSGETISEIISICRKYNVLVCCDDVKQGYRFCQGSSLQTVTNEKADMYTFSKGLANGHRISCLVSREEVMEGAQELTYTSYYDLLPVAAALETLKKMRSVNGYEHMNAVSRRLVARLRNLFGQSGLPIAVNGEMPIFQFVFGEDDLEEDFYRLAVKHGILLFEGDNQTISYCYSDKAIDELEQRFAAVLNTLDTKYCAYKGREISLERTFKTAWNMMDGASDILPVSKRIELIKEMI